MQPRRNPRRASQLLAATFLLTTGFPIAPVFAEGTQAGTSISNTANVTYRSPRDPGTTINATSNTVSVQVAEVAGITVTASGVTDVNGGQVQVGDTLYYTYSLTNVGNDPTSFRIPNLARVTGPGTPGTLEYSTDGGATWTAFPGSELITNTIPSLANGIVPGNSILVRVPVTISPGAQANDVVSVTLGDTPGDAQNQARSADGGDVYTVDNPDATPGEVAGVPVNGVREASSTAQATVNQTAQSYAFATLLKTRTGYTATGAAGPGDDQISYGLSLEVESTDPTGRGINAASLAGTTVNGVAGSNILVSDAIPQGTTFVSAVAPVGWQTVYTSSPISTDANQATWSTTPIPTPTRVGFVRTGTIAPGTTVTGFQITVAVTGTPTSITVANIGQLFGSTPSQAVGQPGAPVYDESGDQNPSNYSDNGTPLPGTDTNNDGVPDTLPDTAVDDGFINTPASPETGTDAGNNNSGQDTTPTQGGGEASVFTLTAPVPSAVSNGPEGAPTATGPSGTDNDDFTNASSPVPPNLVAGTNATLDPAAVAFTNTVLNSGTSAGNIVLTPQSPADQTHLPTGSTVTITSGNSSVTYRYNGNGTYTIVSSTTGGAPIQINNVQPGQQVNYGVEVNLPPGTPLSTDIDRGFPVPIAAGIDTDANGTIDATNLTIDRVYTGYLKMVKESRILPGTGPAPTTADATFSTAQKTPAPGNVIEYRITYTNISEPQSGTGNIILEAERVVIDENGVSGGPNGANNWARDNDSNGIIDTSNIVGSAVDSGASTITFFSGNPATTGTADQTGTTATTDVTRYVNAVTGIIAPQQSRTFTFRRRMN